MTTEIRNNQRLERFDWIDESAQIHKSMYPHQSAKSLSVELRSEADNIRRELDERKHSPEYVPNAAVRAGALAMLILEKS